MLPLPIPALGHFPGLPRPPFGPPTQTLRSALQNTHSVNLPSPPHETPVLPNPSGSPKPALVGAAIKGPDHSKPRHAPPIRPHAQRGGSHQTSQKRTFLERQMAPGCTNVGVTPLCHEGSRSSLSCNTHSRPQFCAPRKHCIYRAGSPSSSRTLSSSGAHCWSFASSVFPRRATVKDTWVKRSRTPRVVGFSTQRLSGCGYFPPTFANALRSSRWMSA